MLSLSLSKAMKSNIVDFSEVMPGKVNVKVLSKYSVSIPTAVPATFCSLIALLSVAFHTLSPKRETFIVYCLLFTYKCLITSAIYVTVLITA